MGNLIYENLCKLIACCIFENENPYFYRFATTDVLKKALQTLIVRCISCFVPR
jgi:hypothetical protein